LRAKSVDEVGTDWGGFGDDKVAFLEERYVREIPVFGFGSFVAIPLSKSKKFVLVIDF
jgi:hypothetical protein